PHFNLNLFLHLDYIYFFFFFILILFFFFFFFFFFFKQKTAYEITRCWSSDVCSSDLSISGPDDLDPGESGQLCGPMGTDFTYLWNTGETSRCISISQPNTYTL